MDKIGVVRKCGRELICETSVDRSMGEKESAEFSFGMSVNGSMVERNAELIILLSGFICCELSS